MLFDNTDTNITVKINDQCSVLPKCSYIEIDPVKENITIEWYEPLNATAVLNIILSSEFSKQVFMVEFIQNDIKHYYFGKPIDYIKLSSPFDQHSCLRIILSITNLLSPDDIRERLEKMLNVLTPNCNAQNTAITPYNRMFDPSIQWNTIDEIEIKIHNIVRVPVMSDIFYNAPYTTIKWKDGTTTTVKAGKDDEFNKEYGLAMAIAKKYYECLEAPNPRAAFKKAAYKDAHDQTEKTMEKRAYKEEKKKRNKRGRVSSSKKTSKR